MVVDSRLAHDPVLEQLISPVESSNVTVTESEQTLEVIKKTVLPTHAYDFGGDFGGVWSAN